MCPRSQLPSGVLADLVGRRYCLLLSVLFRSIGLIILGIFEFYSSSSTSSSSSVSDSVDGSSSFLTLPIRFFIFILASACEGAAQALGSGTDVAFLHDSLAGLKRLESFQTVLATRSMCWPAAACIANLIGGVMAERIGIQACIYSTIIATLISIPIVWNMKEVFPTTWDERKRKNSDDHDRRPPPHTPPDTDDNAGEIDPDQQPADSRSNTPSSQASLSSDVDDTSDSPISSRLRNRKRTNDDPTSSETHRDRHADDSTSPVTNMRSENTRLSALRSASGTSPVFDVGVFGLLRGHLTLCLSTLRSSTRLQELLLLSTALYAFSEPPHRLRALFFAHHGIAPSMFGAVAGSMFFLSAAGAGVSAAIVKRTNKSDQLQINQTQTTRWYNMSERATLLWTSILPPILQATATLLTGLPAALILMPISFLWGVRLPVLSGLLHRELPCSTHRATVSSFHSLSNRLALAFCLVCLAGPITDATSIDQTIRIFAAMAIIPPIWIARRMRKN